MSTVMKSGSFKGPSWKKIYRSYKTFDIESLQASLNMVINFTNSEFEKAFFYALNTHETLKTKMLDIMIMFL